MNRQLLNYRGLFGDDSAPHADAFLHHEPLQARSLEYNYEIEEHLHSELVQLFLITEGGGLLLSSGAKIPLESPGVLIIPSNRLHGFVFRSEVKGEVFTLPETRLESLLSDAPSIFTNVDRLQYLPLDAEGDAYAELRELGHKIIREIQRGDQTTDFALSLLLQLFLLVLYRSQEEDIAETVPSDNRVLGHFKQFRRLIKEHVHEGRTVAFYAGALRLSPVHLNRVCQLVARKTALQVIHDRTLIEAKKYLRGTNHTVAEVAYLLGFKDPAHFSKFFKKKAGLPPGAFRKADSVS